MTLLAFESWQGVTAADKKRDFTVGNRCSVPGCGKLADHGHHIQRRSFFGRGVTSDYIVVVDGERRWLIGNLTALCYSCHLDVTENRTAIGWDRNDECFRWVVDTRRPLQKTDPRLTRQPPIRRLGAAGDSPASAGESGSAEASQLTLDGGEVPHSHVVAGDDEICPGCKGTGRRKAKEKDEFAPDGARPKKSWVVRVPVDNREDGFDVLETLAEQCRDLLGRSDHTSWRYYTLVETLALLLQHREFVFDGEEETA